ncbi:MAG: DHA2 family efflux MFS transporter permease subunit [Armatimonadetes bacterium]|nr:DHA2 family efflux MFS transporter permease subunit [Armatimonadota bacterium]
MATPANLHRGGRDPEHGQPRVWPPAPKGEHGRGGDGGGGTADESNLHFRWIILIGLITAAVMEVLDTTIINVALPQMAGNLNATTDEIAWVSTGYILSNVVVLPMTAWLSNRFGRKNYLSFSILLFIIASFFCGTSRSLIQLVVWRIVQGAGGAALLSTAQATLRQVFPKEEQSMVQTIFVLGIVVAPTVGPTLGGWITDNYTWPWCFFINVPIGMVSVALVYFFLHDTQAQNRTGAIDYIGILLLTAGLGSLQYVLEEGERDDWFDSVAIQRLSVIAAVSLIALVAWELSPRNKHPVIDFRVLKNRSFTAGLMLFLALGFGLYGAIFIFPLFTQNVLGFSPTATGLVLLPGGLATAVGAMICGRLLMGKRRLADPRALIVFGVVLFIWSMWDLGHLSIASGEPDTRLALIIRGFGLGFLFTPINNVIFAALHGPEIAQGSSFINLARQLGGSFGIAVLNTYIVDMSRYHRYNLVANLTSGNPLLLARQQAAASNLMAHGKSLADAQAGALGLIDHTVQAQASVMAFNDGFLLLGIAFVCAAPAILLLRVGKVGGPGAGAGH